MNSTQSQRSISCLKTAVFSLCLSSSAVVTEFLPDVSLAGKWNAISCAAGHHFHEGRWLQDPKTGERHSRGKRFVVLVDGQTPITTNAPQKVVTPLPPAPSPAWVKVPENPVLGGKLGTCFDNYVIKEGGTYKMLFSWRPKKSIAFVESVDGIHWSEPEIALGPNPESGWEDEVNRPGIVRRPDGYHLWYTGQTAKRSAIGHAFSSDGRKWTRTGTQPVLIPDLPWEKVAVMCPDPMWDEAAQQYRLYYSGGEQYEPDAIGYATSPDGLVWRKADQPIFAASASSPWEQHKVTACQVVKHADWYVMFYIGFRDIDHAAIGIARSRDGITNWKRLSTNPIIQPDPGSWDADACYKPSVIFEPASDQVNKSRWLLWYNGRRGSYEQIGFVYREGDDLGF